MLLTADGHRLAAAKFRCQSNGPLDLPSPSGHNPSGPAHPAPASHPLPITPVPQRQLIPCFVYFTSVIMKAHQNCAMKKLLSLLTLVSLVAPMFVRAETEAIAIECIKSATFLAPPDSPEHRKYAPD